MGIETLLKEGLSPIQVVGVGSVKMLLWSQKLLIFVDLLLQVLFFSSMRMLSQLNQLLLIAGLKQSQKEQRCPLLIKDSEYSLYLYLRSHQMLALLKYILS